jgi:DNA-binding CsgD family transcriptional regulator
MAFLEREQHLDQLDEHFRQAAAGHGRVVFVAGEAGVGKTTLVDAFRRRIAGQADVGRFSCDGLSTPGPLGPIRDLAAALGLSGDPRLFQGESREELFRLILAALAARTEPIVLIGEDAHWADGASLEFLRFLGRRISDLPILDVITYRDDEVGDRHPLRVILGDLATAPDVHRMTVRPLSVDAVRQLADGSDRDAVALHRLTGGNPFFLTEVLASEDTRVPATVGDAVLARAARLSPEARAMLDVASVIGATIDLDLLQRVAGPILDAADACVARGLLHWTDDSLSFRHALAREAILAAIAPPRRRLLHARVLAALRETPPSSGGGHGGESPSERRLALLAHHAEAAGDRDAVLEFAIPAADQATALHAYREAAAQFARALRFGDGLPAAERARLLEGRSVACYFSDQVDQAISARLEALDLWRSLDSPLKEGESWRWLSRFYWVAGCGAEAEAAATAALRKLEPHAPGPELAMAYSNLAVLRMMDLDLSESLRWGSRAITLAEHLGETETLVHALISVGTMRAYVEDARGEEELQRSLQLALDYGFLDDASRAAINLAWTATIAMRLDEASDRFATGIAFANEHDLEEFRKHLEAGQATVRALQGHWQAAEREIRQQLDQPVVTAVTRLVLLTTLGQILARRGDPRAGDALDEALVLAERNGQLTLLGPLRAARAEAALLAGDPARVREEAQALRDLVFTRGNRWLRGEFAWLLWRAGATEVPTNGVAEPYALQIAGDSAKAAAAWQALGCPYEAARALAESDDPTLLRQASGIFEQLGAQPALSHTARRLRALGVRAVPVVRRGPYAATRTNPAGLTRREVEVLALLADGLRNSEIADQLYLTPKTVSHHVTAILGKLGVETRIEAAREATKLGITSET